VVQALKYALEALALPPDLLGELDAGTWARLAPVVVGRIGTSPRSEAITAHLLKSAPDAAADAVDALLDRGIEDPATALRGAALADRFWSPQMAAAVAARLDGTRPVPEKVAAELVSAWLGKEREIPEAVWTSAEKGDGPLATTLLLYRTDDAIRRYGKALRERPEWGRTVLRDLSSKLFPDTRWKGPAPEERTVAVLLDAIHHLFPNQTERIVTGIIGPDGLAWLAWNALLEDLTNRGTPEAVLALAGLQPPERYASSLGRAKDLARTNAWRPHEVRDIARWLDGHAVVRNDTQLLDLLIETLHLVEREDLRAKDGLLKFLWTPPPVRPRGENDLSDMLKHHLEKRGLDVTREEEIRTRRGDSPGERADLLVHHANASVIVEVKPNWSPELRKFVDGQLGRYFEENPSCNAGLILLGWFDSATWDPDDTRVRLARSWVRADLLSMLEGQARSLGKRLAKDIRVLCMDLCLEQHAHEARVRCAS